MKDKLKFFGELAKDKDMQLAVGGILVGVGSLVSTGYGLYNLLKVLQRDENKRERWGNVVSYGRI